MKKSSIFFIEENISSTSWGNEKSLNQRKMQEELEMHKILKPIYLVSGKRPKTQHVALFLILSVINFVIERMKVIWLRWNRKQSPEKQRSRSNGFGIDTNLFVETHSNGYSEVCQASISSFIKILSTRFFSVDHLQQNKS